MPHPVKVAGKGRLFPKEDCRGLHEGGDILALILETYGEMGGPCSNLMRKPHTG